MASWHHLPTEILQVIFKHLEEKKAIPSVPRRHLSIASKDLAQCQRTCKHWTQLAQTHLYTQLELANLLQLRSFVHTLMSQPQLGLSIENISFTFKREDSYDIDLFDLFSTVVCFCPDLKGLYTNFGTCIGLWNCIQAQKLKGYFPKLGYMTRPQHPYHQIPEYNLAAYSIRDSLCELSIYCSQLHRIENNGKKLEHFINLNTIYYLFYDTSDIYTIHKQVQRCPSVKWIDITYSTFVQGQDDITHTTDRSSANQDLCPNVQKLSIRKMVFDKQLPDYIMKVFPNLDTIDLHFKCIRNPGSPLLDKLSTDTALRFLSYLLKMKSVHVSYIPLQDVDDVIRNLQGIYLDLQQYLDITYTYDRSVKGPTYLKLATTKFNLQLQVIHNTKRQLIFPQVGLKETYSLMHLRLDMGMQPEMMKAGAYILNNEASLCHIFHRYPNLKFLHILNTPLVTFGNMKLLQQKRYALRHLTLERTLIGPDLLESLSFPTYRIDTLTIRDSVFFTEEGIRVSMPHTEFNRIELYVSWCRDEKVGLQLKKTRDSTRWFLGKDNKFEPCTEEVYRVQGLVSFSIQCADIGAVHLYLNKHQFIF